MVPLSMIISVASTSEVLLFKDLIMYQSFANQCLILHNNMQIHCNCVCEVTCLTFHKEDDGRWEGVPVFVKETSHVVLYLEEGDRKESCTANSITEKLALTCPA